ncbi:MAG: CatB-related O-acetyltransferase [Armatimonadetes bacterium]|nr:CatB-related O-acetyltransferase [Armatimonadota bacterium]
MIGPDPNTVHPMEGFPQVCFIKNTVSNPNIIIGDKLIIGRFCALATGVRFIMNGANHKLDGPSTYPFSIFGTGWERVTPAPDDLPFKGDAVVGNDVWIGYESLIMPGVHIGDGAIIAARSVVVGDVEPYMIVGGNPAVPIRRRCDQDVIAELLEIAWWNWSAG